MLGGLLLALSVGVAALNAKPAAARILGSAPAQLGSTGDLAGGDVATCTASQKAQRRAALAAYRKRMAAERRAYFKAHKSAKLQAAFVKRQAARLRALRRRAACTVSSGPPLPPSSNASCSLMLAQNEDAARSERAYGFPFLNEGPITADASLPSIGQTTAVMLFADFSNHPGTQDARAVANRMGPNLDWFKEVSYGRFSVTLKPVLKWFRMPHPSTAYPDWHQAPNVREVLADAIHAADPEVDFSQFQFVYVVFPPGWEQPGNPAFSAFPGHGVTVDGTEIRHGNILGPGANANPPEVAVHELMHSLGLPDIYREVPGTHDADISLVGQWDLMSLPRDVGLLAWHKWRLHWLDPAQLTCLQEPGQLDETLTPLETRGGKKMVVVPTSPSTAYVVEVRRPIGIDSSLAICHGGVLIYTVDSQVANARGAIRIEPATGICQAAYDLGPGQVSRFEDSAVKVELLQTDGKGYRVRVTRK
jgi:M6 family metalloprotease-like protein